MSMIRSLTALSAVMANCRLEMQTKSIRWWHVFDCGPVTWMEFLMILICVCIVDWNGVCGLRDMFLVRFRISSTINDMIRKLWFKVSKSLSLAFACTIMLTVCYAASGDELTNVSTSVILPDEPKALQGRILFKPLKKFFKKNLLKVLLAALAAIGIVKLLVTFVLPFFLGVHTAKKVFLKILLFFIPAAGYLFKLCSVYEEPKTKYHKHHHLITHSKVPPHGIISDHHHGPVHRPYNAYFRPGPNLLDGHHLDSHFADHPSPESHMYSLYKDTEKIKQLANDDEPLKPELFNDFEWGGGDSGGVEPAYDPLNIDLVNRDDYHKRRKSQVPKLSPFDYIEQLADKAEHDVSMKLREKHLRDQLRVKGLPYGHTRSRLEQHLRDKIRYREYLEQQLKNYEQTISTTPSPAPSPSPLAVPVITTASQPIQPDEPFYSPMIHKMDEIFNNIGFNDEPCRKRLICSMYKTPENFSPYSNYISNELSKDLNELKIPIYDDHEHVLQFFEYLQAARDGQDHKDCMTLYTHCTVKTE